MAGKRVVIVGAGFGGLYCARALKRADLRVTVVDRRNHHLFQPLLYQVATAALTAPDIAAPVRKILRSQRNAEVMLAEATGVDLVARKVLLAGGELDYDFLVIATGATHSYFGHDEWARFAPGLKTFDDAFEIRHRVLLAFEQAEIETDEARRKALTTFVIVGAGPTGVELAGALAEIARKTMARDFRNFDPARSRVLLLDATDRVLPAFPPQLSASAAKQLETLGVEVRTGARVTAIDEAGVQLGDERIDARTVIWAAGVQASPMGKALGAPTDRAGRVLVEPDLSVPGHPDVFVIGDLAAVKHRDGWVPGVAPAAIQMGWHTARNIRRRLKGDATVPFRYSEIANVATIGRRRGVADVKGLRFSGALAWLLWLVVHIFWLIGFRNRVSVLFDWMWAYVTWQRSARVILEETRTGRGTQVQ
ncbi:MAG: NAD(P)/FAD-dependent oxidoreductase [Planctomycetes bacterium]|nr:NAD(P)/FAD-dependent oxidoreductase [Planctomycetota bacterium]MCW8136577.1 NAD(P)/FAD-dependent oxidoreductase [Planctomycetota bacterium]